ncbi:MAG: diguanylate cyclase [bacterium]|nr:diguanylate cyclase [bacterium]
MSHNILIVEDSPTQAFLLKNMIESDDYSVTITKDGLDAVNYLKANPSNLPDLILTDIHMPNMDGYQLARHVSDNYENIFIIILTSTEEEEIAVKEAFDSGATDFLTKPVKRIEIQVRMKNVLRLLDSEKKLKKALSDLSKYNVQLKLLSETDELTQTYNRRAFLDILNEKIETTTDYKKSFSFAMLDIDHFKKINDTYGHLAGDDILKAFIKILRDNIKNNDIIGRYGGDEFLILLTECPINNAIFLTNKIISSVRAYEYKIKDNKTIKLSCSAGICQYNGETTDELISKADDMLYAAKEKGRDRLEADLS